MNADQGTDSTPVTSPRRAWMGLAVLTLPALLVTMDLSVLFLAVPALGQDLEPSGVELLWITDVYGFFIAGFLITMGTLGDRVGRRRLLMIGGAAFAAASVVAAFSPSPTVLIAARALLGVAGATLAPSSLALIRSLFPDERRRRVAIGIWMACFAGGAAVGPVVGGVLLEFFWWGSVFLLNVPVIAVMLTSAPWVLPESRDPHPGRLDLVGAGLSVVALLFVVYGVKDLAVHGFHLGTMLTLAVGLAVAAMFVRRQRVVDAPLVDLGVFRAPSIRVSVAAMMLSTAVMAGMLLFVTQYLQLVRDMGPLQAGAWSVPAMIGSIGGSVLAPVVAVRFRSSTLLVTSMVVAAVGLGLFTGVTVTAALPTLVTASLLMGLGAGAIGTLATDLIVSTAPPERAGAASAISETSGELGGALGIALLGTIGTAVYRAEVNARIPTGTGSDAAQAVRDTLAAAPMGGLPTPVLAAARDAFVTGLQAAALTGALLMAAAAATAALALRRQSDHVDGRSSAPARRHDDAPEDQGAAT